MPGQFRFKAHTGGRAIAANREQPQSGVPETRINRAIRVREVRLIAQDGSQVGIVAIDEALRMAEEAGLDLVEVAPEAKPPVCKIYDFKKAIYEKKKKLKESKKKATQIQLKEVKVRVAIDSHDLETKLGHARKFLEKGDKVKFTIVFRGREITRPQMGETLIQKINEGLRDIGELDQEPQRAGKQINLVMGRRKDWVPPKEPKEAPRQNAPAVSSE